MVNFSSSFMDECDGLMDGWVKNYWGFHAGDAAPMH